MRERERERERRERERERERARTQQRCIEEAQGQLVALAVDLS